MTHSLSSLVARVRLSLARWKLWDSNDHKSTVLCEPHSSTQIELLSTCCMASQKAFRLSRDKPVVHEAPRQPRRLHQTQPRPRQRVKLQQKQVPMSRSISLKLLPKLVKAMVVLEVELRRDLELGL